MGKLTLALFGPPEAYHQGQLLHFPTRKSLALLVYLAVERGLHPREQLDALLWPDSAPKQARAALRNTLLRLRSVLDGSGLAGSSLLLQEGERLGISPQADVEVDLRTLEAFLAGAARGEVPLSTLARVINLPRGDFLEGFSLPDAVGFDDWAAIQREYWSQKLDQVLELASREQIDAGQAAGAVDTAQHWVAVHPLSETAHRRLMDAHLASGNREAALRAFTACQNALRVGLSVEPAQETRDLYERIRSLPPRFFMEARRSRPVPLLTTLELPLVGRGELHRALVQVYWRCGEGAVQAVLLEGEPGIGKTRLAREFLAWAALQGAEVIYASAFKAGGRLPYQAIAEALSQPLSSALDWPAKLGLSRLGELARIIPMLPDLFAGLPVAPRKGDAQAQSRLLDAAARVIETLAKSGPVVWLLDDLQWMDGASLDLLQSLAHRWSQAGKAQPVLFVFTLRGQGLSYERAEYPALDLEDWLAGWSREVNTQRLILQPIGDEEVDELVYALVSRDTDEAGLQAFSRWLYRETEGQPLFIHETVKALIESGLIRPQRMPGGALRLDLGGFLTRGLDSAEASGLPSGIRELIRSRLGRISKAGLSLLATGAVLGKGFLLQHAALIAGLDEEAAMTALDELLASGLLVEATSRQDPAQALYLFSHDKVREVVGLETNAARRARLHRRAFEVLEAAGAPAAELSHHALAGGLRAQGLRYSIQAGDQALQLYALREAVRHYRAALEIARAAGRTAHLDVDSALPDLFLNLGRAYELLNEFAEARETYQRMEAFAVQTQQADLQVIAMNRQATLIVWQNFDLPVARGILQDALRLADGSGHELSRFETTWNLAQLGVYVADPQALEYAQCALSLASQLERPDLLARSWNVLAHVHILSLRWEQVEQAAKEAFQLNQRLNDRAMQAENLALISQAQVGLGRIVEGVEMAQRARSIAQEIENTWGQVFASFSLGMALIDAGQYEQALAVARQGMEMAGQFRFPALRMLSFVAYGVACLVLFQTGETLQVIRQAQDFIQLHGQPSLYTDMIFSLECAAAALAGNWVDAAQAARQAVSARQNQPSRGRNLPIWLEVEALLRAGDVETARQDFEQLSAQSLEYPRQRFVWLLTRGVLARQAGDPTTALESLNEALQLAQRVCSAQDRIFVMRELAQTHRNMGRLSAAGEYLAVAKKAVEKLAGQIQEEGLRSHYRAEALRWLESAFHPG